MEYARLVGGGAQKIGCQLSVGIQTAVIVGIGEAERIQIPQENGLSTPAIGHKGRAEAFSGVLSRQHKHEGSETLDPLPSRPFPVAATVAATVAAVVKHRCQACTRSGHKHLVPRAEPATIVALPLPLGDGEHAEQGICDPPVVPEERRR